MFRDMRRYKQAVPPEDCAAVLKTERRGVLSVLGDDGYPYGIPLDFYYDEAENAVYFHGAREGHKIDAIRRCDKVCFTVWNTGFRKPGSWAWNVTSVVAFGRAELIESAAEVWDKLSALTYKYWPAEEAPAELEMQKGNERIQMIVLRIEHMSGKLVNEK